MKKPKLDIGTIIKRLRIETVKLVNTKMIGKYSSVFKGRGLEFYDYRQYSEGDDAAMIDWKASVRGNNLLVKEFVEERNLNVFFLIDVSSSMMFSTIDKLKIEYAAELVATLSYTILKAGDCVGFALFSNEIIIYSPPSAGMKQHYKLLSTIVDPRHYGGDYDLVEALRFILTSLKELSVVIVVSDFIGLKKDWQHYINVVGKRFDLIGVMVLDPVELELPDYNGQVVMGDCFSGRQLLVNVAPIKENYKKHMQNRGKELTEVFIEADADLVRLTTDKPFIKPITDLFLRRGNRRR